VNTEFFYPAQSFSPGCRGRRNPAHFITQLRGHFRRNSAAFGFAFGRLCETGLNEPIGNFFYVLPFLPLLVVLQTSFSLANWRRLQSSY
jgi:hypothetical protein